MSSKRKFGLCFLKKKKNQTLIFYFLIIKMSSKRKFGLEVENKSSLYISKNYFIRLYKKNIEDVFERAYIHIE